MRKESFWINNLSFLDKLLSKLRFNKVLWDVNINNKIVLDTWCWYNAVLLNYIKDFFKPKKLIAYDLNLNKIELKNKLIICLEWNLNEWIDLDGEKVDIIFSTAIVEHLDNPQKYINSIFNTLNNGWFLILTIPSIYSKPVLEFMAYRLKIIDKNEIIDHKKYYDKKSILKLLQKSWFKSENIKHKYFQLFMNNYCIVKK